MKFKYWRESYGYTEDDARTIEGPTPARAAVAAADCDHANYGGWEYSWPVTYRLRGEDGRLYDVEVARYTVPEFSAEHVIEVVETPTQLACGCRHGSHPGSHNMLEGAAERDGRVCKLGWPVPR